LAQPEFNVPQGHDQRPWTLYANLENAFKIPKRKEVDGNKIPGHKDIDATELAIELISFQDLLAKSMGSIDILNYLTKRPYLPVAIIV
jgi:hypothetical protein